jgi:hypothetical protein
MKRISFSPTSKADVRAIDKQTAMSILIGLHRSAETGHGDVKAPRVSSADCADCESVAIVCYSTRLPTPSTFTAFVPAATPTVKGEPRTIYN